MLRGDRQIRLGQAALLLTILTCWEVLPRAGIVPKLFVPPLSEALGALIEDRAAFLSQLPVTLLAILPAYAIA